MAFPASLHDLFPTLEIVSQFPDLFSATQRRIKRFFGQRFCELHDQIITRVGTNFHIWVYDLDTDEYKLLQSVPAFGVPMPLKCGFALTHETEKEKISVVYRYNPVLRKYQEKRMKDGRFFSFNGRDILITRESNSSTGSGPAKQSDPGEIWDVKTGEKILSFEGQDLWEIRGTEFFLLNKKEEKRSPQEVVRFDGKRLIFVESLPENFIRGQGVGGDGNLIAFTSNKRGVTVLAKFPRFEKVQEFPGTYFYILSENAIMVYDEAYKGSIYALGEGKWKLVRVLSHESSSIMHDLHVFCDPDSEKILRWNRAMQDFDMVYRSSIAWADLMVNGRILLHTETKTRRDSLVLIDITTDDTLQILDNSNGNGFYTISPCPDEYLKLSKVVYFLSGESIPKEVAGIVAKFL